MIDIFDKQKDLARYAGPGKWNDPDMLEVGNGGMTTEEYRTHFSLWCMLASPLMAGNDLNNMTPETKAILLNKEMIAIDQDSLGRQATCFRDNGDYEIWVKALSNNEKAICLLNKSDEKKPVLVDFDLLAKVRTMMRGFGGGMPTAPAGGGMPGGMGPGGPGRQAAPQLTLSDYKVRDIWEHKDLILKETSMYVEMLPHSVKVYRFIRK